MKLSVIIPCYNEKKTIKKIIDKIFFQKINLEIIGKKILVEYILKKMRLQRLGLMNLRNLK